MHASLEQLIEIKDGLSNEASTHVQACEICRAELETLQAMALEMESTASLAPPSDGWQRVQQQLESERESSISVGSASDSVPVELLAAKAGTRWNSLTAAVYTLALSVFVSGLITFYSRQQQPDPVLPNEVLQASLQELMLNSRGLERVLQRASIQNDLLSSEERSLVDRLHWRLMYVDQMIEENSVNAQPDAERVRTLWNERIDTLTELNQLYYQAQYALVDADY